MPTADEPIAQDPLLVQFARRAIVRASLYDAKELTLIEAIGPLKAEAANTGLTHRYGQDFILHIIGDAFAPIPHDIKIAALDGLDTANGHDHMPSPLAGALISLKDNDHVAFHRLLKRLAPCQRRLLDAQVAELKRTGLRHGHRRRS